MDRCWSLLEEHRVKALGKAQAVEGLPECGQHGWYVPALG